MIISKPKTNVTIAIFEMIHIALLQSLLKKFFNFFKLNFFYYTWLSLLVCLLDYLCFKNFNLKIFLLNIKDVFKQIPFPFS